MDFVKQYLKELLGLKDIGGLPQTPFKLALSDRQLPKRDYFPVCNYF